MLARLLALLPLVAIAAALLMYATGRARQARVLGGALILSYAVGVAAVLFVGAILIKSFGLGGLVGGLAAMAAGILIGALVFTALTVAGVVRARSDEAREQCLEAKATPPPRVGSGLRTLAGIGGAGMLLVVPVSLYQALPGLHSEASLVRDATSPHAELQKRAAGELERRGAEAIPGLIKAAADPSTKDRGAIPPMIAKIGGDEATVALVELLKSEHREVRRAAAFILQEAGDPAAYDALFSLLESAPSNGTSRSRFVSAIAGYGRPEAFPRLVSLYETRPPALNRHIFDIAVVESSCGLGHPSAIEFLEEAALSKEKGVRQAVAKQSACFKTKRGASLAFGLLADRDQGVCRAANDSLMRVTGAERSPVLHHILCKDHEKTQGAWRDWLKAHPDAPGL
jgi:hypothetical protein